MKTLFFCHITSKTSLQVLIQRDKQKGGGYKFTYGNSLTRGQIEKGKPFQKALTFFYWKKSKYLFLTAKGARIDSLEVLLENLIKFGTQIYFSH